VGAGGLCEWCTDSVDRRGCNESGYPRTRADDSWRTHWVATGFYGRAGLGKQWHGGC